MVDVVECMPCSVDTLQGYSYCTWKVFWFIIVDGFNTAEEMNCLWDALEAISRCIIGAWVVCGDFNNVVHLKERIGSTITINEVARFRQSVRTCGLQEHMTQGTFFTWSNKQDEED